jgi:hypothetical protein
VAPGIAASNRNEYEVPIEVGTPQEIVEEKVLTVAMGSSAEPFETLLQVASVVDQDFFIRIHVDDCVTKDHRGNMSVEVQVIRGTIVPTVCDPGLDNFRSQPDVIIILPRIVVGRRSKRRCIALGKTDEVG